MEKWEYGGSGRLRAVTEADRRYNIERERLAMRKSQGMAKRGRNVYQNALNKYKSWYDEGREQRRQGQQEGRGEVRPGRGRLMMQSAACLAVLALLAGAKYLPFGPSRQFVETVKTVATVSMEDSGVSEALGKLKFVSNMIPDSVLVFWNKGFEKAPETLEAPLKDARLALKEGESGWFLGEGPALAMADGKVKSVVRSRYGGYRAVVEHSGGMSSSYEPLTGVRVAPGDELRATQSLGTPVTEEGHSKLLVSVFVNEESADLGAYFKQP
ncbi:MAG: M23 family metallopeptidase [Christensenellaceae bacterium]|nr:M23 family metallopeptidase [Christensenellaceae bacterium]